MHVEVLQKIARCSHQDSGCLWGILERWEIESGFGARDRTLAMRFCFSRILGLFVSLFSFIPGNCTGQEEALRDRSLWCHGSKSCGSRTSQSATRVPLLLLQLALPLVACSCSSLKCQELSSPPSRDDDSGVVSLSAPCLNLEHGQYPVVVCTSYGQRGPGSVIYRTFAASAPTTP